MYKEQKKLAAAESYSMALSYDYLKYSFASIKSMTKP